MVSVPDFYILIFRISKSGGCGFESHQELSLVLLVGTPHLLFCKFQSLTLTILLTRSALVHFLIAFCSLVTIKAQAHVEAPSKQIFLLKVFMLGGAEWATSLP